MGHPAPGGLVALSPQDKKCPRFISRASATSVEDFKESRMEFDNATNLDRKSGGSPTVVVIQITT
jgi:hypothetical protein